MMIRLDTATAEPCVWMTAGIVKYKLCDRHFDCEHCGLDAALRGPSREWDSSSRAPQSHLRRTATEFPGDRLYAPGHTWLQTDGQRELVRLGLDSFAASLLATPRRIAWGATPRMLHPGDAILSLEFDDGELFIAAPIEARLLNRNLALDQRPERLLTDSYGDGWLVTLTDVEPAAMETLLSSAAARERSRLDLRRLRRRIALHLLAEDGDCGLSTLTDSARCADPWHALGGIGYLGLVREVIH